MAQYLKKKKLYEIVKKLLADKKLPPLKNCEYKFYRGAEWLTFSGIGDDWNYYRIASQCCGNWISIEKKGYEDPEGELVWMQTDIYSEFENGEYKYHSVHKKG